LKKVGITIQGIPKTMAYLKKEKIRIEAEANQEIHKQGFKLEGEVKDSIAGRSSEQRSVDTGRFLNSVQTDTSVYLESKVFSDVPYAPYLEFGTTKINERKHFRNSLDRRKPVIIEAVNLAVKF